jgi:hypothetical protein
MRASHIALIAAVVAIPSVGYAQQDNGPVGGMVGPEGSSSLGPSLGQPRPSLGSPYGVYPSKRPARGLLRLGQSQPDRAAKCARHASTRRNGFRLDQRSSRAR